MYNYDRRTAASGYSAPWSRKLRRTELKEAHKAWLDFVGRGTPAAGKKLLGRIGKLLEANPLFEGYKFQVEDNGLWGGDIGTIGWKGSLKAGNRVAFQLRISSQVVVNPAEKNYFVKSTVVALPAKAELGIAFNYPYPAAMVEKPKVSIRDAKALLGKYGEEKLLQFMGGPKKGRQSGPVTLDAVKAFIRGLRTWFVEDPSYGEGEGLYYTTRDGGDVGSETPGREDIAEARRVVRAIDAEFGTEAVKAYYDTVDEWTNITVELRS